MHPLAVLNPLEMKRLETYVKLWYGMEHMNKCSWENLAVCLSDEPNGGWVT